jgi:hypothetical protein
MQRGIPVLSLLRVGPERRKTVRAQQWHRLLRILFIVGCVAAGVIWAIYDDLSEEWEKEADEARSEAMSRGSVGVDMLWQVYDAQRAFKDKNGKYGTLDELAGSELIDEFLAQLPREGYVVNVVPDGDKGYAATAYPLNPAGGQPSFFLDQTGALRWRECKTADDPPADATCEKIEQF